MQLTYSVKLQHEYCPGKCTKPLFLNIMSTRNLNLLTTVTLVI